MCLISKSTTYEHPKEWYLGCSTEIENRSQFDGTIIY